VSLFAQLSRRTPKRKQAQRGAQVHGIHPSYRRDYQQAAVSCAAAVGASEKLAAIMAFLQMSSWVSNIECMLACAAAEAFSKLQCARSRLNFGLCVLCGRCRPPLPLVLAVKFRL
jgi:hypothetical protein